MKLTRNRLKEMVVRALNESTGDTSADSLKGKALKRLQEILSNLEGLDTSKSSDLASFLDDLVGAVNNSDKDDKSGIISFTILGTNEGTVPSGGDAPADPAEIKNVLEGNIQKIMKDGGLTNELSDFKTKVGRDEAGDDNKKQEWVEGWIRKAEEKAKEMSESIKGKVGDDFDYDSLGLMWGPIWKAVITGKSQDYKPLVQALIKDAKESAERIKGAGGKEKDSGGGPKPDTSTRIPTELAHRVRNSPVLSELALIGKKASKRRQS